MTTNSRRTLAITLEDKTAWWISRRSNVLFRCGQGVGVASQVKSALDKSGFRWLPFSAQSSDVNPAIADDSVEALFIVGLDRASKRVRHSVLSMLGERPSRKMVWVTVTVSEDDFDLETADPLHAEGFDIVVDVLTQPTRSR